MKWWKRIILTAVSLIWGYISLDYLYLTFCFLTGQRRLAATGITSVIFADDVSVDKIGWELFGLLMFLLWALILAAYIWLIRKLSPKVDITELDREGKEHIRRTWSDVFWQMGFVATGALLRWGYLCVFYFPRR